MTVRDDVYILKHKDIDAAEIAFNEHSALHRVYNVFNTAHMPIGTLTPDGKADNEKMFDWWSGRAIPKTRTSKDALRKMKLKNRDEFVLKTLGRSLTDHYWVCPSSKTLKWKNINYYENIFAPEIGELLFSGYSKNDSVDISHDTAESTLGGQLRKRWIIIKDARVLVKGDNNNGSIYNEVISSELCKRMNIPVVSYIIKLYKSELVNLCSNMTNTDIELVPACQVYDVIPKNMNDSMYKHYVKCAETLGYKNIRRDLDKMIFVDALIRNEDRHFNNFGLLRNSATLEIYKSAPLFDQGNSLWHRTATEAIKPTSDCPGKCFEKTNFSQLKYIKDFSEFNMRNLVDIGKYFTNIINKYEFIAPKRAEALGKALDTRVEFFKRSIEQRLEKEARIKPAPRPRDDGYGR